jgi:hypothetical protein
MQMDPHGFDPRRVASNLNVPRDQSAPQLEQRIAVCGRGLSSLRRYIARPVQQIAALIGHESQPVSSKLKNE